MLWGCTARMLSSIHSTFCQCLCRGGRLCLCGITSNVDVTGRYRKLCLCSATPTPALAFTHSWLLGHALPTLLGMTSLSQPLAYEEEKEEEGKIPKQTCWCFPQFPLCLSLSYCQRCPQCGWARVRSSIRRHSIGVFPGLSESKDSPLSVNTGHILSTLWVCVWWVNVFSPPRDPTVPFIVLFPLPTPSRTSDAEEAVQLFVRGSWEPLWNDERGPVSKTCLHESCCWARHNSAGVRVPIKRTVCFFPFSSVWKDCSLPLRLSRFACRTVTGCP